MKFSVVKNRSKFVPAENWDRMIVHRAFGSDPLDETCKANWEVEMMEFPSR